MTMQYRALGRSGLKVSTISLGSWLTFGNSVDQAMTEGIVRRAFERGVNLFDTADVYARGAAEEALGKAIAGIDRRRLVLATKCFFPMSDDVNDKGLSRKHIHESVHASLRRLRTDYVDLFQCHRPDPETPVLETVSALDDLIRQGKILYWGVSMWPATLIRHTTELCDAQGLHRPISNQPPYNLLERGIEHDVIPESSTCGLAQIVYSPLAQGVLTGKYTSAATTDVKVRAGNPKINQFITKWLTKETLKQVDELKAIARSLSLTPAQVALAFVLHNPGVASAIVGATSEAQLDENLSAVGVTLPAETLGTLQKAFPTRR